MLFPDVATPAVLKELEAVVEELSLAHRSRAGLLDAVAVWEERLRDFNRHQTENKDPNRLHNRGGLLLGLAQKTASLTTSIPNKFTKLRKEVAEWETEHGVEFEVRDERFMTALEATFAETNLVRFLFLSILAS